MAIHALPQETTRILNSCQVLTTSASLVKELIDNALDARASSIDIIISSNTLDKIEVRDNGFGIASGDLGALGRRGYTSKLRDLEELKIVGGSSLGFRGEALASAVELGEVTVTTRTDGELVGNSVKLKPPGIIGSRTTASHPVGTTVSVANFLTRFPVRRQTAEKDSKKTVSAIRRILQSYALARPNVRLHLKVLKAPKSNWSFAPRQNSSIREAVSQIFGSATAAQCMEKSSVQYPCISGSSSLQDGAITANDPSFQRPSSEPFVFQAFIPKPNTDFSKIGGGHHVSVDSRPVSSARGPLKKMMTMYKSQIEAAAGDRFSEKLTDPFICLNIVCSPGSYDANVEPAKDNVIFESPLALLALAEKFFKSVYGLPAIDTGPNGRPDSTIDESERSLARKVTINSWQPELANEPSKELSPFSFINSEAVMASASPLQMRSQLRHVSRSRQPNMRNAVEESMVEAWLHRSPTEDGLRRDQNGSPKSDLVYHVAITPPSSDPMVQGTANLKGDFISAGVLLRESLSQGFSETTPANCKSIYENILRDENGRNLQSIASQDATVDLDPSDSISQAPMRAKSADIQDSNENQTSNLNPWTIAKLNASASLSKGHVDVLKDSEVCIESERPRRNHFAGGVSSLGRPQAYKPSPFERLRRFRVQQSAISDQKGDSDYNSHLPQQPQPQKAITIDENVIVDCTFKTPQQAKAQDTALETEVYSALDYERRKEDVTRRVRQRIRAQDAFGCTVASLAQHTSCNILSKHLHRSVPTVTVSVPPQDSPSTPIVDRNSLVSSPLPDGDPRAYLMRRRNSLAAYRGGDAKQKPKRTKTVLLPLETITEASRLNNLVLKVQADVSIVRKAVTGLRGVDDWAASGKLSSGLIMHASEVSVIEKRIRELLVEKSELMVNGETHDLVVDLSGLRGKSVAVA